MPNDFETCDTGTRNLVVQQGEKIERLESIIDELTDRLCKCAAKSRSAEDAELYARELQQWIADRRADR